METNDRSAPPAGGTVVSFAAGTPAAPGAYKLRVYAGYVSGTLGAPEQATAGGNFQLFLGNSQIGNTNDGFLGVMPTVGVLQGPFDFDITLDGNTSISLAANQAASAAVIYRGVMLLTPINLFG
jgi:hypothetical protein